jgi:hypothetical protein
MEILRWQIGDATVFRIAELDATAALQGLVPKFDLADLSRDAWLIPNFVDENRRLRGLVQGFLIIIADQKIVVDPGVTGRSVSRYRDGTSCRPISSIVWRQLAERLAESTMSSIPTYISTTSAGTHSWSTGHGSPHFPLLAM